MKSKQKNSDFEWSGFQMVGTIAIALDGPFKNPYHSKFDLKKVWIWNFSGF